MTLPANVLYKSQSKAMMTSATFTQTGQDLLWTNINLPKRGASLRLRLKVNVTNCADGTLQFAPGVIVGGACPAVAATPVSGTVRHLKNWAACGPPPTQPPTQSPPTQSPTQSPTTQSPTATPLCSLATSNPGAYACPASGIICGREDSSSPSQNVSFDDCVARCTDLNALFMSWKANTPFMCVCITRVDAYGLNPTGYQSFALGQPRDRPAATCNDRRRLEGEEEASA
jgi:hypothetical protein